MQKRLSSLLTRWRNVSSNGCHYSTRDFSCENWHVQRENMTKTEYISEPSKFFDLVTNPNKIVKHMLRVLK